MASDKIRLGVIGANISKGWAHRSHLPALMASPEFELTAVCTTHEETAEESKQKFGAKLAFHDHHTMMMHFKRAVEKKPEFSLGYRGLGKVHLMLNDPDIAMREFEKAIEITADDTESLFQLARLHQERGESAVASELYRRVVQVDRFSPMGALALARLDSLKSGS